MGLIEVSAFGRVRVRVKGAPVELAPHSLGVFVRLLLARGRPVGLEELFRSVWARSGSVGHDERVAVQKVISDLRHKLDLDRFGSDHENLSTARGDAMRYQLTLGADSVDLYRFDDTVGAADADPSPARWLEALAMWTGRPLGGIVDRPFIHTAIEHYGRLRDRVCAEVVNAYAVRGDASAGFAVLDEAAAARPSDTDLQSTIERLRSAGVGPSLRPSMSATSGAFPDASGLRILGFGRLHATLGGFEIQLPPTTLLVFCRLLIARGRLISVDELYTDVWQHIPSRFNRSHRIEVQRRVSDLRRLLKLGRAPEAMPALVMEAGVPSGYRLLIDSAHVDLWRFEDLVRGAASTAGHDDALAMLDEGLGIWGDRPLLGLPERGFIQAEVAQLVALRDRACEELTQVSMLRGKWPVASAALHRLQVITPSGEPFHELAERLRAIVAAEKSSPDDASSVYGVSMRSIDGPSQLARGPATPAQLPAEVAGFVGRHHELVQLDRLFGEHAFGRVADGISQTPQRPPMVISAVSGMGGVGKTALALRLARHARDRFPDGQLYVNLRGYETEHRVTPSDALAGFLQALGVNSRDVPVDTDQRSAMFRTLVDGRRMLILLDNASSPDQVRPLIPGASSCGVLITSRERLTALVARDGARRLELDLLSLAEAVDLLRDRIGERASAEPEAILALADRCGRLPLALRIAAEMVAAKAGTTLGSIVDELAEPACALDALSLDDDRDAAVRAVLMSSYQQLAPAAANAFRSLGLYPAETFDSYAVAALTGGDLRQAQRLLSLLANAHLVEPTAAARFRMHDLVRAFANERGRVELDLEAHSLARGRLFACYLSICGDALDYVFPAQSWRRPVTPPATLPLPFNDRAQARTWLGQHRNLLCELAQHAYEIRLDAYLFRFSALLASYLRDGGFLEAAAELHRNALTAAERIQNPIETAYALLRLGRVLWSLHRGQESFELLTRALPMFQEANDRAGEALTILGLGSVHRVWGRIDEDLAHQQQALEMLTEIGDEFGQVMALQNIGMDLILTGRNGEALASLQRGAQISDRIGATADYLWFLGTIGRLYAQEGREEEARAIFAHVEARMCEIDDPRTEAHLLNDLGLESVRQGNIEKAMAQFTRLLELSRAYNDRFGIGCALNGFGRAYLASGRYEDATRHLEAALNMCREFSDPINLSLLLNDLGEAETLAGRFSEAVSHHDEALTASVQVVYPFEQARALSGLAEATYHLKRIDDARTYWHRAIVVFDQLRAAPHADDLRRRLAELGLG
jgi:tetratricopeptide (TPR) repeat protein/DNA-binding winged helix-turn-helix (wHTH) protein